MTVNQQKWHEIWLVRVGYTHQDFVRLYEESKETQLTYPEILALEVEKHKRDLQK